MKIVTVIAYAALGIRMMLQKETIGPRWITVGAGIGWIIGAIDISFFYELVSKP